MKTVVAGWMIGIAVGAGAQTAKPADLSPGQRMAATVVREWPAGVVSTTGSPGNWGYEEGVLLDGMAAEWHATANGADFAYIKAAVDKYVTSDGAITGYKAQGHTLDDIEMGRAVLLVYRVTQEAKYAKAAKFLHEQLALQPRTASGGYWHKQIYPNQMWLDGAYMAEPFRAEYADTFQQAWDGPGLPQDLPPDWDDIAKQLLLMDTHMRDPKTGLLKHGWDESKSMPWADKTTGLSPEVWARAMGWYSMALVDVLDWFPKENPKRAELLTALKRTMAAVVKAQDPASGLWWQVMSRPGEKGNYFEASASCMFTYALAKGVRKGYLPQADEANAKRGWEGIQKKFVTADADGGLVLHGTVKVGGLGGTPYRSGTFDYYIGEKVVDQDAKGVGAFLLAGSEMEQASTEALGQGKTALIDAWFNSQTKKDALGGTHLFHYKWDDDSYDGYSLFGRAFERYGAALAEDASAPTPEALKKAQIYVIVSPDIPAKNPNPHYMDKQSADTIAAWVKAGGVLLLFANDPGNADISHYDILSDEFGIHFNAALSHHVVEPDHTTGELTIPPGTGIFGQGFTAYMKDTCTITVSGPAKAIVTDKGDVMIAESHVGKGVVLAVVDPWFYNEYADGRKVEMIGGRPLREFDGFEAAQDIAGWAVRQAK
jgi:unsaturated rhamnogalacturonyl hydrolase